MQQNHRLDNEISDSSDSESDQAEPIQDSTELRRLGVTTKKANRLPGSNRTKHADLDISKPMQPSPKDPPSHHDPKPAQPNPKSPLSHQDHPKSGQLSITTFLSHQDHPGLDRPPRAAPNDRMQRISETSADFASLPHEHRAWRRQATAANTGSDENDQRLQNTGATSALMTSSTPTKKRRRVLDDVCSSAFDNPPKRLRPDGHL